MTVTVSTALWLLQHTFSPCVMLLMLGCNWMWPTADFLVQHLQTLVDLGFKLTTGSAESLRPSGAQLLQQLLRFFGAVPDPDVPELLLLEQYQVGVVTKSLQSCSVHTR